MRDPDTDAILQAARLCPDIFAELLGFNQSALHAEMQAHLSKYGDAAIGMPRGHGKSAGLPRGDGSAPEEGNDSSPTAQSSPHPTGSAPSLDPTTVRHARVHGLSALGDGIVVRLRPGRSTVLRQDLECPFAALPACHSPGSQTNPIHPRIQSAAPS